MTQKRQSKTRQQATAKMSFTILTTLLIIALLIISGCAPVTVQPNPNNPNTNPNTQTAEQTIAGLRSFSSIEEYQAFAKDHSSGVNNGGMYYARDTLNMVSKAEAVSAPSAISAGATSGSSGQVASDSYSQTNNQVASVDEADMIKTDGKYIYTLTSNTVFIVQAVPGNESKVVSTVALSANANPQNLFIFDNKLVVMGTQYGQNAWISARYAPYASSTYAYVYDVTDKENPTLETNFTFEGSFTQARLKDGMVYLVTQSTPEYRDVYPMPLIMKDGVQSEMPIDRMFFMPTPYDYPITMTVHSIDLSSNDDKLVSSTGLVVESNQNLYMSDKNIYLAGTTNVNEWQVRQDIEKSLIEPLLTTKQVALIARVNNVADDILSPAEKKSKISEIYYERLYSMSQKDQTALEDNVTSDLKTKLATYDYFEHTVINKLSYKNGIVTPVASAQIPGSANNQFSFNENNNVLAVATTVHQHWSSYFPDEPIAVDATVSDSTVSDSNVGSATVDSKIAIMPPRPSNEPSKSQNMVFTLDKNLNVLGSLKGIALGEQIYSTRFDGDRLYMVTFRQVDPFYVIDLSDASNPTILGKLKLPGFSRYLHPVGNNKVLGLGQDATTDGRIKGLKVTLFDATNVEHPVELSSYIGNDDYAQSTALFDHHAFLYSAEKQMLVIPVQYYNYDYYSTSSQNKNYAGALVFHVDEKSITLRGLVDHAQGSTEIWNKQVERSLYIGDLLYTKSPELLRVNNISNLHSIASVELKIASTPDGIVVY